MDFGDEDGDTTRLRTQYTAMVMFIPALMTAKISILLLYLDIARQLQKFFRVGPTSPSRLCQSEVPS